MVKKINNKKGYISHVKYRTTRKRKSNSGKKSKTRRVKKRTVRKKSKTRRVKKRTVRKKSKTIIKGGAGNLILLDTFITNNFTNPVEIRPTYTPDMILDIEKYPLNININWTNGGLIDIVHFINDIEPQQEILDKIKSISMQTLNENPYKRGRIKLLYAKNNHYSKFIDKYYIITRNDILTTNSKNIYHINFYKEDNKYSIENSNKEYFIQYTHEFTAAKTSYHDPIMLIKDFVKYFIYQLKPSYRELDARQKFKIDILSNIKSNSELYNYIYDNESAYATVSSLVHQGEGSYATIPDNQGFIPEMRSFSGDQYTTVSTQPGEAMYATVSSLGLDNDPGSEGPTGNIIEKSSFYSSVKVPN